MVNNIYFLVHCSIILAMATRQRLQPYLRVVHERSKYRRMYPVGLLPCLPLVMPGSDGP